MVRTVLQCLSADREQKIHSTRITSAGCCVQVAGVNFGEIESAHLHTSLHRHAAISTCHNISTQLSPLVFYNIEDVLN